MLCVTFTQMDFKSDAASIPTALSKLSPSLTDASQLALQTALSPHLPVKELVTMVQQYLHSSRYTYLLTLDTAGFLTLQPLCTSQSAQSALAATSKAASGKLLSEACRLQPEQPFSLLPTCALEGIAHYSRICSYNEWVLESRLPITTSAKPEPKIILTLHEWALETPSSPSEGVSVKWASQNSAAELRGLSGPRPFALPGLPLAVIPGASFIHTVELDTLRAVASFVPATFFPGAPAPPPGPNQEPPLLEPIAGHLVACFLGQRLQSSFAIFDALTGTVHCRVACHSHTHITQAVSSSRVAAVKYWPQRGWMVVGRVLTLADGSDPDEPTRECSLTAYDLTTGLPVSAADGKPAVGEHRLLDFDCNSCTMAVIDDPGLVVFGGHVWHWPRPGTVSATADAGGPRFLYDFPALVRSSFMADLPALPPADVPATAQQPNLAIGFSFSFQLWTVGLTADSCRLLHLLKPFQKLAADYSLCS
jgi:hypothetical protein